MKIKNLLVLAALALFVAAPVQAKHKNFKVSVYVRAFEVQKMQDTKWLEDSWKIISSQLDVDKIYLETHRDLLIVDDATLEKAKKFFEKQGIEVAGGLSLLLITMFRAVRLNQVVEDGLGKETGHDQR